MSASLPVSTGGNPCSSRECKFCLLDVKIRYAWDCRPRGIKGLLVCLVNGPVAKPIVYIHRYRALASAIGVICSLLFQIGVGARAALAVESWQSVKLKAERYAVERKYRLAADTYEQGLQLVPANRENDRVDMQLALAGAYNNLIEIDKAVAVLQLAGDSIKALKTQNKLDPQVVVSLKTLLDASDKGYPATVPYEQRTKAKMRISESINAICADVYPQANTTRRKLEYARTFISNGDLPGCERQLQSLHKSVSLHDPMRKQIEWALASVQQRNSKPQLLEALTKRSRLEKSEVMVLAEVAGSQMWAANYDLAKQNLNKALDLLKRKPNRDESEVVIAVYVDIYKDTADNKGAEPWLRKRLALFTPKDGAKYIQYSRELAHNLRRQHKFQDADAVMPKKKKSRAGALHEWEWFLTDKEKADVEKAESSEKGRNIFDH